MKWPETVTVVRHGESEYNVLRALKDADPLYQEFKRAYNRRKRDPELAKELAGRLMEESSFVLGVGDHDTALTDEGRRQAEKTGAKLRERIKKPDVVFVSPYMRTHHTLGHMAVGWPGLSEVRTIEEERIREQEHGMTLLYNDWRIFQVMHPEQEQLRNLQGPYWYRYPQGENVPDVRERLRSFLNTITRDYREQNVLVVMHHLAILSLRANLERLDPEQFRHLNDHHRPINCGVTIYRGNPEAGRDGRLELDIYNEQLY